MFILANFMLAGWFCL